MRDPVDEFLSGYPLEVQSITQALRALLIGTGKRLHPEIVMTIRGANDPRLKGLVEAY